MPLNEWMPASSPPRNLPELISTTGANRRRRGRCRLPSCAPRCDETGAYRQGAFAATAAPLRSTRREPASRRLEMAFYELRQYKVRPGKMDAWVKIMEEEIIPFQVSKGLVICGSFRGETDDSVY